MWPPKKKSSLTNEQAQEAPITRIAAAMIHQAIHEKADGIRLLPNEAGMQVEYRISGIWTETMRLPKRLELGITTHLKEMAGLPTQYRMALQGLILIRSASDLPPNTTVVDAEYEVPVPTDAPRPGEQDYDLHLVVTPTRQGEQITMKIEAANCASH